MGLREDFTELNAYTSGFLSVGRKVQEPLEKETQFIIPSSSKLML